jgi:hypothetical protein
MPDLDKALADIGRIRRHMASAALFQGFGPGVIALTGGLALLMAALQARQGAAALDPWLFARDWVLIAIASAALIGVEMLARARRRHGGLADALLMRAVLAFLPVGAVGAAFAVIVLIAAPDAAWIMPGLWQMLIGIGLFAALANLPRAAMLVAAWYLGAGAACLWLGAAERTHGPWLMGIPFGFGQLMMAAILHRAEASGDGHD